MNNGVKSLWHRRGEFIEQFARALFLFGVILLVWRRNKMIDFGVYLPAIKPSDVLIVLAFIVSIIAFVFSGSARDNKNRNELLYSWGGYFSILFLFFFIGSLWSRFVLGLDLALEDFIQVGRIGIGILALFLILFFGFENQKYIRLVIISFLSALILIPFLFMSEGIIFALFMVVSPVSYTFLGFHPSTIVLGSFLLIPINIFFSFFLYYLDRDKPFLELRSYIYILCVVLLTALLLWTGSRSAWISAAAGMFVVLLFQFFKIKNKPIFSLGLISILFVFISAFLLLPTTVRNTVLVRFFPNLDLPTTVKLEGAYRFRTGSFVSFLRHEPLSIIWPIQVPSASVGFRDGRFDVWQKYTEEFIRNPLGLGLNYASVIYQDNISGQSVNAHNVLLQVALSGGVGGFFVFLFILWKAGKGLYKYARENYSALILALTGVFSGMIVNTMFFDALEIRWFWIILGLAIVVPTSRISSDKEVVVK